MNRQTTHKPLTVFAIVLLVVCAVGAMVSFESQEADAASDAGSYNYGSSNSSSSTNLYTKIVGYASDMRSLGTFYVAVGAYISVNGSDDYLIGIDGGTASSYGLTIGGSGMDSGYAVGYVNKAGSFTITYSGMSGSGTINFTAVSVTQVTSATWSGPDTVKVGETITVSVSSNSGAFVRTAYISTSSTLVSISSSRTTTGASATITGNAEGSITLTASFDLGNYKATKTINVVDPTPVTSVSISGSSSGEVGSTITLTATTSPTSATDRHVTWSITSGSTRASISSTSDTTTGGRAVISLNSAGSITVRATAADGSGVYGTKTLTITQPSTPTLPDGVTSGSGTSSDPYIISMTGGNSYNITVSPVGTFTAYRAIGSDITIPGISFTTTVHGTFSTLTTTHSSAGQLSSLVISGTPEANGSWDFYAYNPANESYYRIVVTGVANSFTLSFNANGGTGAPSSMNGTSASSTYSFSIPATAPSRSGYTFEGWNTRSAGTGIDYQPGDTISVSPGTTTLYAKWSQITYTSTLAYSASGATNVPSTQTYTGTSTANHTFTISSLTPTKSGMVFLGWSTSSGATTASYQPGSTISVGYNSTRTLYAVWETATLDITTTQGDTSVNVGQSFTYTVGTNVSGCVVSVTGAPWLSVSGNTISGTPTSAGTYNVTVTIAKDGGYTSDQQSFKITVYSSMGFTSEPGASGIYAYVE